jgi:BlaI family penicillinase repressor
MRREGAGAKAGLTGAMSRAEWGVMRAVRSSAPCLAQDVVAALRSRTHPWARRTVKAFLGRLVRKGLVTFGRQGRAYLCTPTTSEDACQEAALNSFARTVFGCSVGAMPARLASGLAGSREPAGRADAATHGKTGSWR